MKNENFTAAQSCAIESSHPLILCAAGPGSGKTTVLSSRIRRLIDTGVKPAELVAITYTNAAARHLEDKIGFPLAFCGTLHGFCLRMLKQHGTALGYGERTAVIDEDGARELITSKAKLLGTRTPLDKLVELNKTLPIKFTIKRTTDELVILAYREELKESGLLDFDLILQEFLRLVKTGAVGKDFTHLFVDEVQDSAFIDWQIYIVLPIANKFYVGDPDQSIYGFRGGRPDLMFNVLDQEIIVLEANFRCGPVICDAANKLIVRNAERIDKKTVPANLNTGRVIQFAPAENEGNEIAQVVGYIKTIHKQNLEIAILARTNAIANGFRDAVAAAGLPVAVRKDDWLPPDWGLARALIEYLAAPANDTLGFFYVIAREVKKGTMPLDARKKAHEVRATANGFRKSLNEQWFNFGTHLKIDELAPLLDREQLCRESRMLIAEKIRTLPSGAGLAELALAVASTERPEEEPLPAAIITVSTIHAAKGREFDVVFLVGMEDEIIPANNDVEEERRVLYVGITRARNSVYFSYAGARTAYWGNKPIIKHSASRFLKEIAP